MVIEKLWHYLLWAQTWVNIEDLIAFWLSLCFGSFILFLVCHDTAFSFSTRAMTRLADFRMHYNHMTFTPIAETFMLYCTIIVYCKNIYIYIYCRLIYVLSMLYVRLAIKVKVGILESFKVGWYPHKITG